MKPYMIITCALASISPLACYSVDPAVRYSCSKHSHCVDDEWCEGIYRIEDTNLETMLKGRIYQATNNASGYLGCDEDKGCVIDANTPIFTTTDAAEGAGKIPLYFHMCAAGGDSPPLFTYCVKKPQIMCGSVACDGDTKVCVVDILNKTGANVRLICLDKAKFTTNTCNTSDDCIDSAPNTTCVYGISQIIERHDFNNNRAFNCANLN